MSPTAFNSRIAPSTLVGSNPVGEALLSREDALAAAKAAMLAPPAKENGLAGIFPYYLNDTTWSLRLIRAGLADTQPRKWNAGLLLPAIDRTFRTPGTVAPAELPIHAAAGLWELPGVVAWKRGGLYGVVFHDVIGAAPERELKGVMGGGPTALWHAGTGTLVASMAPEHAIAGPDDATASCVCGEVIGGGFFHSGSERSTLRGDAPDRVFEVSARLRPIRGDLVWRYTLADDGLRIAVSLRSDQAGKAWINLPIPAADGGLATVLTGAGTVEVGAGGTTVRLAPTAGRFQLTGPLAVAGGKQHVRCCRLPLPADGTWVELVVTGAP